ncbi:MAG TPA: hypothetical protein VNU19_19825, partial [Candidatus Acidoferrum sp.]|nr:hypothetical protein [Candidatus Acidoferrum sp.]
RARTLLSDNRPPLDAVVAALLEKETISGDELAEIVHRTQAASDGQGPEKPSPAGSPSATR